MASFPAPLLPAVIAGILLASIPLSSQRPSVARVSQDLRERVGRQGRVRVIVELNLDARGPVPEGFLPDTAKVVAQREAIARRRDALLSQLPAAAYRVLRRFQTVPYVALDVGPAGLAALEDSDEVFGVMEDEIVRPFLAESVPLIQGDQVWDGAYDGSGRTIAVLDTGVDSNHPFLLGKVVEEACYSSNVPGTSQSFCPNGSTVQLGPGSAAPCPLSDCLHGTHVAGIAAGNGTGAGETFSGVAKGARLMAVQVFSRIIKPSQCGGQAPCLGAFTSDVIAGLERVYAVAGQHNFASVNMSLGGGLFAAPCDTQPYKPIIDNLRSLGIATVAASGNSGSTSRIATPACISTAISVGSTSKGDEVSWFSNVAPFLSLFAPGESIVSSVPGVGFFPLSGTSMATPHVAGAWALLKQAAPGASVSSVLGALRQTGLPVTDTRGSGTTVPRVRVFQALATLVPITSPSPVMTGLSPARASAGSAVTLTITGAGFNAFSAARWNGAAKPTTVVSTTQIRASIPAVDLPAPGTALVTVSTPPPGGGVSSSFTFTIDPPPTLTVSATAVAPGGTVTATLANGFGGSGDWLGLAAVGSPDGTYLQSTYVGAGVTDRTWTVTMPTNPGAYEFRLFVNNAREATSPSITVDPSLNPVPTATSLSPSAATVGGAAFTLMVNGSGFVASSIVKWNGATRPTTFVSANQLQAAIGAPDIAAVGTAQVTVFSPSPGGGTSTALPFTISPPPTLTVSATNVAGGSSVTVTLTNGLGGSGDWMALAASSAPDTSHVQYTYVGGGVTTRTWTVTMPLTAGTYEFRLFLNNGYMRAATSPTITVSQGPNPVSALTSLSPSSATVGGPAFTLTVNGNGFVASSTVRWEGTNRPTTFVTASQLQAAISASDIATVGTAQITVFSPAPGGGTSNALPFTVSSSPTLTVSATSVPGGGSVTVTLTNGLGGSGDWLALAASSASDISYIQYTYVGAGVTTRTWTVTMPLTAGTYEFRLFLNNGYTRAATSPTVTVVQGANPVPVLSSLSPNRSVVGGSAFTLTINGSNFVPSSIVRWNGADRPTTVVSATQLQAAIGASDLTTVGTAQVTVFSPPPGGGTSTSSPFTISPPPTLTVSATSVAPGTSVTVTLANGLGGSGDWMALAASGASDISYIQYTYVGAGVTTRTWSVSMPTTPGNYEFRLFLNNGYTRAATSPPVTVTP